MGVSSIYSCREGFRAKFKELKGDSFEQLSDIDKTAYLKDTGIKAILATSLFFTKNVRTNTLM